jgi:hypothetical protein
MWGCIQLAPSTMLRCGSLYPVNGQFLAQTFDVCTFLADDHTRTRRVDRGATPLVRTSMILRNTILIASFDVQVVEGSQILGVGASSYPSTGG